MIITAYCGEHIRMCALTSEGVCPEGEEGQGEGEVTHTRVGLEQSHQREQDVGEEHWMITEGGKREGGEREGRKKEGEKRHTWLLPT